MGGVAVAQSLPITETMPQFQFERAGKQFVISRSSTGLGAKGACPSNCIQPQQAAPGVRTVGELELMQFLAGPVSNGTGLLIDTRSETAFAIDTIPGAVSIPQPALASDNSYLPDILRALGATEQAGVWDFSNAYDLLVFGNGPASSDAAHAIEGLITAGFPAAKLGYYRSGISGWTALGLTTQEAGQ